MLLRDSGMAKACVSALRIHKRYSRIEPKILRLPRCLAWKSYSRLKRSSVGDQDG